MKPNFKSGALLGPDLIGCKMGKVRVVMNKPVYLGQVILDLSKTIMYEFYYDYMIPKYGDRLKLCYMDTDSLIYSIKTEDFYSDISPDVESRFDTSGYPNDGSRPLPIGKNKKVIGLMKDELGGEIMTEFVNLRPKMYDYRACLFSGERTHRSQLLFRSRKHEVKTLEVNKLALSREDDKRITINGAASYARGHYRVWGCE